MLTDGLLQAGVGRVIEADSASAVEDILRAGSVGHLALLSLAFGTSSNRLIQGLRDASWARVIALAPTADIRPVLGAIESGACGVLRGRPGAESEIPDLARELSARELEVLELGCRRANEQADRRRALVVRFDGEEPPGPDQPQARHRGQVAPGRDRHASRHPRLRPDLPTSSICPICPNRRDMS